MDGRNVGTIKAKNPKQCPTSAKGALHSSKGGPGANTTPLQICLKTEICRIGLFGQKHPER